MIKIMVVNVVKEKEEVEVHMQLNRGEEIEDRGGPYQYLSQIGNRTIPAIAYTNDTVKYSN